MTGLVLPGHRLRTCRRQLRRACVKTGVPPPPSPAVQAQRLMDANPNSFRKLVATFLEANGRGYWDASPEQLDRLRQMYMDVEDKIEGVE